MEETLRSFDGRAVRRRVGVGCVIDRPVRHATVRREERSMSELSVVRYPLLHPRQWPNLSPASPAEIFTTAGSSITLAIIASALELIAAVDHITRLLAAAVPVGIR